MLFHAHRPRMRCVSRHAAGSWTSQSHPPACPAVVAVQGHKQGGGGEVMRCCNSVPRVHTHIHRHTHRSKGASLSAPCLVLIEQRWDRHCLLCTQLQQRRSRGLRAADKCAGFAACFLPELAHSNTKQRHCKDTRMHTHTHAHTHTRIHTHTHTYTHIHTNTHKRVLQ